MVILLLGKNGQVGWELQRSLSVLGNVVALDRYDSDYCGDISNFEGIAKTISAINPAVIVNATAYTAVDQAESDQELCFMINALAVENLAKESEKVQALLIHYSTDYVFNGTGNHYRTEKDETEPVNFYGYSKLAGEEAIRSYCARHIIFRTSWVYATRGHNFIKTMLSLFATRETLSIVDDQIGAPTGADLIADITALSIPKILNNEQLFGTYHLVASGETSWYGFAEYIKEIALKNNCSLNIETLDRVATAEYKTSALRPLNSRLSISKLTKSFNVTCPDWHQGIERCVKEIIEKQ